MSVLYHDDKQVEKYIASVTRDKKVWKDYDNGNYHVWINVKNGTKIRFTTDDFYNASRPESIDMKITNRCDMGCPQCHENSHANGLHADIEQSFIDSFPPHLEVAVGGGNVLSHPRLEQLLERLNGRECLPSITVHQKHFIQNFEQIKSLCDRGLVYGVGVSLSDASDERLINMLTQIPSSVLHTIVGIVTPEELRLLSNRGIKILFLGYKNIRRGSQYLLSNAENVNNNTIKIASELEHIPSWFDVVSFDNLALAQLPVRDVVGEETWKEFYMGDDGDHTFYIDMVERQFALSSSSLERFDIGDNDIISMFAHVKSKKQTSEEI